MQIELYGAFFKNSFPTSQNLQNILNEPVFTTKVEAAYVFRQKMVYMLNMIKTRK